VYVQFHVTGPTGQLAPDGAKTDADGKYRVPLHSPGEYVVTAFWPRVTTVENEEIEGEDRLRGRYRNRAHPASKLTIRDGENELPAINLTLQ
jgi:hypothetical protein